MNADDFGFSHGINRGIVRAHERGIVTSTSVMVRWPAAAEVTDIARRYPNLGFGLHMDMGEWIYRDGEWAELHHVLSPQEAQDPEKVFAEVKRQLAAFHMMTGQEPTHLDSHQHAHRSEPLRSILISVAAGLGIPLRHFTAGIRYCGDFYGQGSKGEPFSDGIAVEALLRLLQNLSHGVTELCCHPGNDADYVSQYRAERAIETAVLCDSRVRDMATTLGIELATFRTFKLPASEKTGIA